MERPRAMSYHNYYSPDFGTKASCGTPVSVFGRVQHCNMKLLILQYEEERIFGQIVYL